MTVTWTVEDDGSEISSEPCAPFTQTTDVTSIVRDLLRRELGGDDVGEVRNQARHRAAHGDD